MPYPTVAYPRSATPSHTLREAKGRKGRGGLSLREALRLLGPAATGPPPILTCKLPFHTAWAGHGNVMRATWRNMKVTSRPVRILMGQSLLRHELLFNWLKLVQGRLLAFIKMFSSEWDMNPEGRGVQIANRGNPLPISFPRRPSFFVRY